MNRGKEWWIKEIAALAALVALWVLYLLRSTTIAEAEVLLGLGYMSMLLPFLTKKLVGILLRIRLAPQVNSSNAELNGGVSRPT